MSEGIMKEIGILYLLDPVCGRGYTENRCVRATPRWLPRPATSSMPFRGEKMQRINLAWFSQWGRLIQPLMTFDGLDNHPEPIKAIFDAREYLRTLGDENAFPLTLRASRPIIWPLISELSSVLHADQPQEELKLRKANIYTLSVRLNPILEGELGVQATYHVWPKRAYDIDLLTASGAKIFGPNVVTEFSEEELYNLEQAGKCLAFEVPTAAAFHMFRAAESVLRRYYQATLGTLPKPKARNWGVYIKNLKEAGADAKIMNALDQIRELYRNPIIHPEAKLDLEEALSLVGIMESAISGMIIAVKTRGASAVACVGEQSVDTSAVPLPVGSTPVEIAS